MNQTEAKDLAFELEKTAVSTLAEYEMLERTLQGVVISGKRASKADEIKRVLTGVEEQAKKDRTSFRSLGEGEAHWVNAYPEGNRFLFFLVKLPSDPVQGWAKARFYGEAKREWVFVPYTIFCEALQTLHDEILGGTLDSALKDNGQGLVYARLKAIFQTQISKIGAEPAASQPQKPLPENAPRKPVDPIDKILEEFGWAGKSSPSGNVGEPQGKKDPP